MRSTESASNTPPPALLGAALVFWGWHTQVLSYAVLMGLVLEGARWIRWRWKLSDQDFNRVTDLTSVGFVLVVLYQFDTHAYRAIYPILALLPFVMFVLVAIQIYSTRDGVRLTALFLSIRRAVAKGFMSEERSIDLSYSYFVVCLVSASAGQVGGPWYFAGVCALSGMALFAVRSGRYATPLWSALFLLAIATGYLGHSGVLNLRAALEPVVLEWFQDWHDHRRSPYRAYTAIGAIGRLKQSDRIILRVRPDERGAPALLREASYQSFSRNLWLAGDATFSELEPEPESAGTVWRLHRGTQPDRQLEISAFLKRGRGLLAIPNGTHRIERLPVEDLALNPLGALKINRGPELITYQARYNPQASYDLKPTERDLVVPGREQELLNETARQLGLAERRREEVLGILFRYFNRNFTYSLALHRSLWDTPLSVFLNQTKSGHCEYFATATVLLLRTAGIPARYATGYSVQEYSELEQSFVVRRRHAHSWALAYIDGVWRDFDTTPAVWAELESDAAPWWESVYDLWAWLSYQFSRWRWGETEEDSGEFLIWLLAPLLSVLGWRLFLQERVAWRRRKSASHDETERLGMDSEFFLVENRMKAAGLERNTGETVKHWIERCARSEKLSGATVLLEEILPRHYDYRFDPNGIDLGERMALRHHVSRWLESQRKA